MEANFKYLLLRTNHDNKINKLMDKITVKKPILQNATMVKAEMLRYIEESNDKKEVEKRYEEIQKQIGKI